MHEDNLARARARLRALQLDGAWLSNAATITWLTGYAPPILSGPSPFEGSGAVAWLDATQCVVLVSDGELDAVQATGALAVSYTGYQIEQPLAPTDRQAEAFDKLMRVVGVPRRFGYESLSSHLWRLLYRRWEHAEAQPLEGSDETNRIAKPLDGWADDLRAVKSADEIARIGAACALCSTAQQTLAHMARSGALVEMSELAIFGALVTAMETEVGERLSVLADLVAGVRTASVGGPPTGYTVAAGDPVLADIVPRLNGYWGDICNVRTAGEPSAALRQMYAASKAALDAAIDAVKPGTPASAIDAIARGVIAQHGYPDYPHHTGHGLGTAWHEEPRICGYNTTPLEAGMIVALEPGVYVDGVGGVRLEHVMLVTADGAQLLTDHTMEL